MPVVAIQSTTIVERERGFMIGHGAGRKPNLEVGSSSNQYFVGIHSEVQNDLRKWHAKKQHKPVATKVRNLIKALVKEDRTTVDAILRQLAVNPIRGCNGLLELGPKQCRGGAARVFLYRDFNAAFFVATGVEKGSSGVKIDVAKKRTEEIRKIFKESTRKEAVESIQTPQGAYKIVRR